MLARHPGLQRHQGHQARRTAAQQQRRPDGTMHAGIAMEM
jgi:hypothetical protein